MSGPRGNHPTRAPSPTATSTLSLLTAMTAASQKGELPFDGLKLIINYGLNRVRFPAPVKVNSRIRSGSRLLEVTEIKGGLQIVREVTVEVEGGEKPCCVAETVVRLYF